MRVVTQDGDHLGVIPIQEALAKAQELGLDLVEVADKAVIVPPVAAEGYEGRLVEYCRAHAIDALIPLIDPELRLLCDARERLAAVGTRLILS